MRTAAAFTTLALLPAPVLACPVCFGASDGPMLAGSNMGILALLVVTLGMLGGVGAFIRMLARREAALRNAEPPVAASRPGAPLTASGDVR
jgi:predicted lipid-binding transport protein (Tim44 family)